MYVLHMGDSGFRDSGFRDLRFGGLGSRLFKAENATRWIVGGATMYTYSLRTRTYEQISRNS